METIDIRQENILEYKNNIIGSKKINYLFSCWYCGKDVIITGVQLKDRLKNQFYPERLCCPYLSECCNKKQADINALRASLGVSANQGKKKTEEEKQNYVKTMAERGHYKRFSEMRKGKSLEEVYGKERSQRTHARLKEALKKRVEETGKYPHSGHKHSIETRTIMSEKASERIKRGDNSASGLQGIIRRWYDGKEERFESSLEYMVQNMYNDQRLYWKRNDMVVIPYMGSKGITRRHIPDIIIYSDSDFSNIKEIIEVKPFIYASGLRKRPTEDLEEKNKEIEFFKKRNNIDYKYVTEKEVYNYLVEIKALDKEYATMNPIVREAKRYINGERDWYQEHQKNPNFKF